jgi:hypothetical protein
MGKSIFEENVGKILATLLAAFIIGTVSMIYSSDKSNSILALKIEILNESVSDLKRDLEKATGNRWTRFDQAGYASVIQERLERIESRIEKLEDR